MIVYRYQHLILSLTLTIILASINLCSFTSAFAVRSRECRGKPSDLLLRPLGGHRSNKFLDGVQCRCDGALLWCNVMSFVASAIILYPSPSMASIQQTYPVSDAGAWSGATSALSTSPSSSVADLGLKPATDTKPQITLTGRIQYGQRDMLRKASRDPILQGLVYYPEFAPKDPSASAKVPAGNEVTQQVDYFNDVLILTAVSASQPGGPVLAGAKLPVSSIRFPFSFQMYEENLLSSRPGVREAWEGAVNTGDIILRASICPRDSSSFPCDDMERKKYAEGVAKLITKLPGLNEGDSIRAPASLALQ